MAIHVTLSTRDDQTPYIIYGLPYRTGKQTTQRARRRTHTRHTNKQTAHGLPRTHGRRADTRTDAVPHTRAGRRATWTAHDDYLLVLSSTHTSCQRHRGARVVARYRLWRQHRPSATGRRATWTAHDDYPTVLSSTRTSCQTRHRRARVAPDTAPGRIIRHRPQ